MTNSLAAVSPLHASLSRAHKAAIILATLNPDTAGAIIQEISDTHLKAFARAFGDLKAVPAQALLAVAQEFAAEVERSSTELSGGAVEAKKMLESLAEEDRANRILAELHGGGAESVWKRLSSVNPEQLLAYLQAQRKPVAATIISKLDFEHAAAVFSIADSQFAHSLLTELARGRAPSHEAEAELARAIEEDFLKPLAGAPVAGGVGELVGEIVNCLPSSKRDAFLAHLDSEDPEVGQAVRRAVLAFQDLHSRLTEAGASTLLRQCERDQLIKALRHGQKNAPETVRFLMANVSKRMAEQYAEDMGAMAELPEEVGESAQLDLMKMVRGLVRAGEIKLTPPPAA